MVIKGGILLGEIINQFFSFLIFSPIGIVSFLLLFNAFRFYKQGKIHIFQIYPPINTIEQKKKFAIINLSLGVLFACINLILWFYKSSDSTKIPYFLGSIWILFLIAFFYWYIRIKK